MQFPSAVSKGRYVIATAVAVLLAAQFGAGFAHSIRTRFASEAPAPPSAPDLSSWSGWYARVSLDARISKSGPASVRITDTGSATFGASSRTSLLGHTAGRRYRLSTWLYVPRSSSLVGQPATLEFGEEG